MVTANRDSPAGRCVRAHEWALVLVLALAFKQGFALASAEQLSWLLWPVAILLNTTGTLHLQPLPSGEWLDAEHAIAIVKACAGTNYWVASWLGYVWIWRHRGFGVATLSMATIAAWLTTVAANSLRILFIAHGQDDLMHVAGLASDDAHRLIGIVVYFVCLTLQMGGGRAIPAATVVYLGVGLVLPLARAFALDIQGPDLSHIAWTAGIPIGLWGMHTLIAACTKMASARESTAVEAATKRRVRAVSHSPTVAQRDRSSRPSARTMDPGS